MKLEIIKINWGDFFVRRVIFGVWVTKHGWSPPAYSSMFLIKGKLNPKAWYQIRYWPPWKHNETLILPWHGCWNWQTVAKKSGVDCVG